MVDMAGAVTEVAEDTSEDFLEVVSLVGISVDSLGAEDLAAEALGATVVEDIEVPTVALGATVEGDIGVVTAALGATVYMEEALVGVHGGRLRAMEVTLQHSIMEDTTIPGDIMEATLCTIIGDLPHPEQPSGFFWRSSCWRYLQSILVALLLCAGASVIL